MNPRLQIRLESDPSNPDGKLNPLLVVYVNGQKLDGIAEASYSQGVLTLKATAVELR